MDTTFVRVAFGILLSILFFSNNFTLFSLTYVFVFVAVVIHTFISKYSRKNKLFLTALYLMIMIFQLVYNATITFPGNANSFISIIGRATGSILALMPVFISRMVLESHNIKSYLPSIQDLTVFTFNELVENINNVKQIIEKGQKNLSKGNINEFLKDLPRHNSFRYINKGSLTDEYFELAYQTLDDPNMYIVISNTGSPASEIISVFTRKHYNHASLSFDRDLKTIVSYNGGERVYPPGLNMEMLTYFNKKRNSSIIVYSLPASREKKKLIIEKIREINEQGNAYNMLGVVFKFSFKKNIMFCSQFVYKMLKFAGLEYFEKQDEQIKPTDLVEMDYERKLNYEYVIKFDESPGGAGTRWPKK
ncbi:MAG: hypothetical protein LBI94_01755 [Treponema sp.]|jgi:hypothetical protein|nr:hypothetical protein [Treponema sp.]